MPRGEQLVLPHPEVKALHGEFCGKAPVRIQNALVRAVMINESLEVGNYAGAAGRYELEHEQHRTLSEIHDYRHDPITEEMLTNIIKTSKTEAEQVVYAQAVSFHNHEGQGQLWPES